VQWARKPQQGLSASVPKKAASLENRKKCNERARVSSRVEGTDPVHFLAECRKEEEDFA